MEATIFICDYAQVNNNKLYVTGAAINLLASPTVEPPHPINVWAAALVTLPWQAHNQPHRLVISLLDEDGQKVPLTVPDPNYQLPADQEGSVVAQFNAGRSAFMQPGDDTLMPLAIPLSVQVPDLGGYKVSLEIDGTELASARFRLIGSKRLVQ
ncbi:DUF6941 family protein [Streptomyces hokutonensis]|uniref:DUF6941 family protein n=1 Tax=Streptomyces hokutonensis TaxID=1306990 RepID=A0ABW6MF52_9ACTN